MQGPQRKIVHATLYELIAIVVVTVAMRWLSDKGAAEAGGLALSTSVVALVWNMVFNTLFEAWERRQASLHRTVLRRVAHAIGFEGGLVVMTVPLIAWWLDMSWWQALITDLGLVVFFLFYTFCFNWAFDHVFGMPHSTPPSRE
ncbi:MAG: PACE efflux transporter [Aquabacterium sp.]|uniref:PACE efflux transporter n=1 Tax=Aquabacterium sp. TaxID=1872578 RepID=UPI00120255A6|nr:PACE efflux transporter [Aquabacterium sp.]TAK96317.1 MAG: PACE efflux transporter [Aquabacterium sp.]